MDPHIQEWLSLIIRWVHVIAGVAWIGASFYFNFLENHLERDGKNKREEIAGNLWAIHGGGFYYLEKYKVGPKTLPTILHWFKWEAYLTWLSGFALLVVVYYLNAKSMMIVPERWDAQPWQAMSVSASLLVVSVIFYEILCRSPLAKNKALLAVIGFGAVILVGFLLSQYFSGRAAFLHVGAIMGTIMATNVFHVIIPNQRKMVNAASKGLPLDPQLGKKGLQRSRHNNYITLPVLFLMISNHYASTYGHQNSWIILAGLIIAGVSLRHFFNIRHTNQMKAPFVFITIACLLAMAVYSYPQKDHGSSDQLSISDVKAISIIERRCTQCHSAQPTDEVFKVAPKGVMFDSLDQIKKHLTMIKKQAVDSQIMPIGNLTGMTEEERQLLGQWIDNFMD